jgi:hypothetical protein
LNFLFAEVGSVLFLMRESQASRGCVTAIFFINLSVERKKKLVVGIQKRYQQTKNKHLIMMYSTAPPMHHQRHQMPPPHYYAHGDMMKYDFELFELTLCPFLVCLVLVIIN